MTTTGAEARAAGATGVATTGSPAVAAAQDHDWLEVVLEPYGCSVVVRLRGELDVATAPTLQECLDAVLTSRRDPVVRRVVVDGAGLTFADASGMSPLLHARAVLAKRQGRVEFPDPSAALRLVLDVLGLGQDGGLRQPPPPPQV